MSNRTCKVGVHGRNDEKFEDGDYQAIREAKLEVVKMMSHTRSDVFKRIKDENPNIEIITRLFHGGGFIEPQQFIQDSIPVMERLKPYCTLFQIHNEPNHHHGVEGWGSTDEDAANFNQWFIQVYDALKAAHPWAELGFPGLAVPDGGHRDRAWLRICADAINKADWLGCHCYWQSPPDRESVMLMDHSGLAFKYYHQAFPDKVIHILECGNSNGQNPAFPVDEHLYAQEYQTWLAEVFKYDYIGSVSFFILSSPDPSWDSFAWRRGGHNTAIIPAMSNLSRPPLTDIRMLEARNKQLNGQTNGQGPSGNGTQHGTSLSRAIGEIPNIFANQHLINAFFYTGGELGIKGDDLLAKAGLDVQALAADEATRQKTYRGLQLHQLPGLTDQERNVICARMITELRNVKQGIGLVRAIGGLNMRDRAGEESNILRLLDDGSTIDVLDVQADWLFVSTGTGDAGYVASRFVAQASKPTETKPTIMRVKSQPPAPALPGHFASDSALQSTPLAATGLDVIHIHPNFGDGARNLAGIWNRYGGLLKALSDKLDIDSNVAVAVLAVESGGSGFQDDNMIIRFENHLFYEEWGQKSADQESFFFDHFRFQQKETWRDHMWRARKSAPFQQFHGNQPMEWNVLNFAASLDDTGAKRSISMGAPQILGRNHQMIGYATVQDMFRAFASNERNHILGLFDFIKAQPHLVQALKNQDYVTFAKGYNGPGQAEFYGGKIRDVAQGSKLMRESPQLANFDAVQNNEPSLPDDLDANISFLPVPEPPGMFIDVEGPVDPPEHPLELPMIVINENAGGDAAGASAGSQGKQRSNTDSRLIDAWCKHVEKGLENNVTMFNQVLKAFMRPYYMTIVMYTLLFLVGAGLFVAAAWLGYAASESNGATLAAIFGGLGVITFLSFFISRPLAALEENLLLITRLGLIYNTYWTRLLYTNDSETVHDDVEDATNDAITEIDKLIDKRAEMAKNRPGLGIR